MFEVNYAFIKNFLSERKNIVITTHKSPDGDALGSSLGLFHAFNNQHNVHIIVPNEYPHYLKWLPGNPNVIIYEGNEINSDSIINNADLIFCLDFNKLYRVDTMYNVLNNNTSFKIMIDHHEDPDKFCDEIISDSSICSTAELVYEFLLKLDTKLNKDIAISLYTGIITDSGSLRYPNVTKRTHYIVSQLMTFDINHSSIHHHLFDSQNTSRLSLLQICLKNLKLLDDHKTALFFLKEKDLMACNYKKGDTEGFVNIPLTLKDVNFSAFFIQFKDGIKISFRSQGEFNVNLFSNKYFNGGGHKNAAGGFLNYKNISKAIDYFEVVLNDFINDK